MRYKKSCSISRSTMYVFKVAAVTKRQIALHDRWLSLNACKFVAVKVNALLVAAFSCIHKRQLRI